MKLVHLSDLHFGTETPAIVEQLRHAIDIVGPELVIVSGDFTQIASSREFENARDFLKSLKRKIFCVPGNHDIPRFDFQDRLFGPFKKYKLYIEENLSPVYETDDVIIAGLNSARPILPHWNWANGAVSQSQLHQLEKIYKASGASRRICVMHHPVQQALNSPMDTVVFGRKRALQVLNDLQVHLVLTGHVHHASVTTLGDANHKTLYLSASTALSSRLRDQENGFNIIEINEDNLAVQIYKHDGDGFVFKEKYLHQF